MIYLRNQYSILLNHRFLEGDACPLWQFLQNSCLWRIFFSPISEFQSCSNKHRKQPPRLALPEIANALSGNKIKLDTPWFVFRLGPILGPRHGPMALATGDRTDIQNATWMTLCGFEWEDSHHLREKRKRMSSVYNRREIYAVIWA